MRAINAPVAVMRNSNNVHTHEDIQCFIEEQSTDSLVSAYVKLYNDSDSEEMFSAGMHALGYPDVQVAYDLIPMESAVGVICEFLQHLLINETWNIESPMQYHSAITDATYELEHYRCERFDTEGEDRFNRNGLWVFTKEL